MSVKADKIKKIQSEKKTGHSFSRFFLLGFAFLPLVWSIGLAMILLSQQTPGFGVEITPDCLVISKINKPVNPVFQGDRITHISKKKFLWIFTAAVKSNNKSFFPQTFTIKNNSLSKTFNYHTIPITLKDCIKTVWPHFLVVLIISFLVTMAVLKAPEGQPAGLILLTLTFFSLLIINEIPFQFGLTTPGLMSFSFLSIIIFHWLGFSAWAHFIFQFPVERQFLTGRPLIITGLYILPPAVTLAICLILSDSPDRFMGLLQQSYRWATPWIITGTLVKHLIDYQIVKSALARSQLKLLLSGGFAGIGPYLFLYLFPDIIFGQPIISFRVVVLFGMLIPLTIFLAIIRYKLMDVDQLISKGATYMILILSLIIAYSGFIVLLKQWVWGRGLLSREISLGLIIFIALVFNPLKTRLQDFIDCIFLKDQLHYNLLLHELSNKIVRSIELCDLIELLTQQFSETFRIQKTILIIVNNKRIRIYPEHSYLATHVKNCKILINELENKKKYLCAYEENSDNSYSKVNKIMNRMNCPVVYGLKSSKNIFGAFMLGNKTNNKIYSSAELQIIGTLINTASIAMTNSLMYESLKESRDQIHQMFNKVTQAEKLAAIGEMSAVLAHEIKNPLGIIRSSAEYLITKKRKEKIQKELLTNIIEEADTLNIVMNNTLGLARYKTPEFNLMDVGEHIRQLLTRWIKSSGHNNLVKIILNSFSGLKIFADEKQLSQVFINLIMNSEDAMQDGGQINIDIIDDLKNNAVVLLFKDTGSGISPEHKKNIFKKFYTSKKDGLGLGLALCAQIVRAHNGSIALENNKIKGVCAKVCLPCHPFKKITQSFHGSGQFQGDK